MKYIRYALYAFVSIFFILLAFNNNDPVDFVLVPDFIPGINEISVTVPLFIVTLGALLVGLVLGYIFEYVREARIRRKASRAQKELKKTTAELESLKKEAGKHDDDVLAILE